MSNNYFSKLDSTFSISEIAELKLDPFSVNTSHIITATACRLLQNKLAYVKHNFGLDEAKDSRPIGKMFGVLIVQNDKSELGYLSAFSGKLNGGNHYEGFVPPVYDSLSDDGFLNNGMTELSVIVNKVRALEALADSAYNDEIKTLKVKRKSHSQKLQQKLFDSYHFLNKNKESKSLLDIFKEKQPQGGSGECAAPKLLQFAYANNLRPLSIAEFWWGISPKSQRRVHKQYYPACEEKCRPILGWMLL